MFKESPRHIILFCVFLFFGICAVYQISHYREYGIRNETTCWQEGEVVWYYLGWSKKKPYLFKRGDSDWYTVYEYDAHDAHLGKRIGKFQGKCHTSRRVNIDLSEPVYPQDQMNIRFVKE